MKSRRCVSPDTEVRELCTDDLHRVAGGFITEGRPLSNNVEDRRPDFQGHYETGIPYGMPHTG